MSSKVTTAHIDFKADRHDSFWASGPSQMRCEPAGQLIQLRVSERAVPGKFGLCIGHLDDWLDDDVVYTSIGKCRLRAVSRCGLVKIPRTSHGSRIESCVVLLH